MGVLAIIDCLPSAVFLDYELDTNNLFTVCDHELTEPQIMHLLWHASLMISVPIVSSCMVTIWVLPWQNDYNSVWWKISKASISTSLMMNSRRFWIQAATVWLDKKVSLYMRSTVRIQRERKRGGRGGWGLQLWKLGAWKRLHIQIDQVRFEYRVLR